MTWGPGGVRVGLCACALIGVVRAQPAFAETSAGSQEQRVQANPEPRDQEQWYGLPIILADTTAVLILGGAAFASPVDVVVGGASVLIYTAGGPITHLAEGQHMTAASSLGLRLLPLAVGSPIIYANLNERSMTWLTVGGSIVGVGSVLAMIVDSAVLAWKPISDAPRIALVPSRTLGGTTTLTLAGEW